jgi:putative spermidine/putrescine transport system substrate-binding protein
MTGLLAAARREGRLNVVALPYGWANYGAVIAAFTARYGIKVADADPEGSSQDEIRAVRSGGGNAPDVVDVAGPQAASGAAAGLWAPYQVASWAAIPVAARQPGGDYYADYGGYAAIGYDPARVTAPPASLRALLGPAYRGQVAIDGDPARAGTGLAAVYAAALAAGGSPADIGPGLGYFRALRKAGNLAPASQAARAPVVISLDYVLAAENRQRGRRLRIVIPADASYVCYYYQAISRNAPHPAAARLWEEFLYSAQGQNLFLLGPARPAELPALLSAGTADQAAYAALPPVPGGAPRLASPAQQAAAQAAAAREWPAVAG